MKISSHRQAPVIEGEFVVLGAAPPAREPAVEKQVLSVHRDPEGYLPEHAKRGGAMFWCGGVLAIAASFLLSGGYALFLPVAPESPLRGTLSFETGAVRAEQNSTMRISAKARNGGSVPLALPPLALAVKSGESSFLYPLPLVAGQVPASGRMSFETRLALPPKGIAAARLVLAD